MAMGSTDSPDTSELAERLGAVERQLAEMQRSGERLREQLATAQAEKIEDLEIALYLEERLQNSSGGRQPFEELARELGFERELLEDEH